MEWQWYQLVHVQSTSLETDNDVRTSSLNFLQARCSSWHPSNSIKASKHWKQIYNQKPE